MVVKIKTITIYEDINLEQLRWEIKYLEIEIISLENEKTSIEKIISDFVHTYTIAFGDLLLKILKLKKEKLKKAGHTKKSEEYEKAEQEYNKFNDQYTQEKKTDWGGEKAQRRRQPFQRQDRDGHGQGLAPEQATRYGAFYRGFIAAAQAGYDGAGSTPEQVAAIVVEALNAEKPETRYVAVTSAPCVTVDLPMRPAIGETMRA